MEKTEMTAGERRKFRRDHYRSELKTAGRAGFTVIAPGKEEGDPGRNLSALESIRRLVYPELSRGIRTDRNQVIILRASESVPDENESP